MNMGGSLQIETSGQKKKEKKQSGTSERHLHLRQEHLQLLGQLDIPQVVNSRGASHARSKEPGDTRHVLCPDKTGIPIVREPSQKLG